MASLDLVDPLARASALAGSPPLSDRKRHLLERYVQGHLPAAARARPTIQPRASDAPIPLSHGQELLWLHAQLGPDLPIYNEPITVHRRGSLDVAALERSLSEILRRHEAWRTTFPTVDGRPLQVVQPVPAMALPVIDLRRIPEDQRAGEALRLATEDARRPFDLARGPLLRALLIRLADDEHRLFLTLHHIIFDGVSTYRVFLPELTALYAAYAAGRHLALPEPQIQYADYAAWQRQQDAALSTNQMAYWRDRLQGAQDLELPIDRRRPPVQTFRGAMQPLTLSPSLSAGLRSLSRGEGVTLFVTLLAAFKALLHRYSGQDDVLVGTVTAGRSRPEIQELLGFFLNPLMLRTDLSGAPTFRELLRRTREVTLGALSNEDVPFASLVKELRPRRDPSRNPLYQALFSLEPPMPALPPGWNLTQTDITTGSAKLDLYLELDDRRDGIVGRFMYNVDLFERATIARLLDHWQTLLAGVVRDPECRLSKLPLLTDAERRPQPRRAGSRGARARQAGDFERLGPADTISSRFEAIVALDPTRVAVKTSGAEWTYGALNQRANQVGRTLRSQLGDGEHRVALLFEHGAPVVAAMLGSLKAGQAYVPLDPRYPRERLEYILGDAQPSLLLTQRAHLDLARDLAGSTPVVDADALAAGTSSANLGLSLAPDVLAYLLYTSGSTGRPKGVMQSQRNVLHFIRCYANALGIGADDRLTMISSCSFDAAVLDVYAALLTGAMLCPLDVSADSLAHLPDQLEHLGATIYHSTPSVFRSWANTQGAATRLPTVRLVVLGGEEALAADVELHRKHFGPDALFVNLAGQTESSLNLLHVLDQRDVVGRSSVPLGHPVPDTEVLLLAGDGEPTELCGEIGVRSAHLALGYWRRAQLTRDRFLPDPQAADQRVFRTGDMARQLADGSLAFLGRRDLQVKVRGVRIELGEVEAALRAHPGVRDAAAASWEPEAGDKRLAAYWVSTQAPAVPAGALRDFLRTKLPEPMVPSVFVLLEALPRTPSGKLDRRALPLPERAQPEPQAAVAAPGDALEEQLRSIWSSVLGLERVGLHDDFFDLGGHSLLAVRVFAEIDKTLGLRAPLATLLEAPTVARLARVLRARTRPASATLVALQPLGQRPPFFGVHGHSGEVLFYGALARRLGPDQPCFALQAGGLRGTPAQLSIEAMAARYIEELRTVQPQGPYAIGGYCLGALVAFEMAQQLVACGEKVALLALFVGYTRDSPRRLWVERVRQLQRRLGGQLGELRTLPARSRLAHVSRQARGTLQTCAATVASGAWRLADALLGRAAEPPAWLTGNVAQMNLRAARGYVPGVYPGRMTVFLSGSTPPGFSVDPERDLGGLRAQELEVISVPGTTDTMMAEPHVRCLSARLQEQLAATLRAR